MSKDVRCEVDDVWLTDFSYLDFQNSRFRNVPRISMLFEDI